MTASALVISAGKRFGTSYRHRGGMLFVERHGHLLSCSLSQHPYEPASDQFQHATQSFPMLLLPGGQRTQFRANASRDARGVVALDTQGHLFIVSLNKAFSLDELARPPRGFRCVP